LQGSYPFLRLQM